MPTLPSTHDLGLLLVLLVPVLVAQVSLAIFALRDLTRPERRVKGGNKWLWAAVIIFGELVGPLVYFLAGREDA